VPGTPVPWQRAATHGKQRYNPASMRRAKEAIRVAWLADGGHRLPSGCAVGLSALFFRCRKPEAVPDLSNYLKLVEDALIGLAYDDDCVITDFDRVRKRRARCAAEERTEIVLWDVRHRLTVGGSGNFASSR